MPTTLDPPAPTPSADAWSPPEIARRVENVGVQKAHRNVGQLVVLSILAGAFLALGSIFHVAAVTGSDLGLGPTRLLGGLAFSLGLVLVIVAGAELFTSNNLIAMAWASGRITTGEMLRDWTLVYAGNVVGALGTVVLVALAGVGASDGGALGETAVRIARAKVELGPIELLARGVLGNALVCLAVWLAMGGHSVSDRLLAVLLPITAFVALGLEHSIANWFYLPYAILLEGPGQSGLVGGAAWNIAFVTVGNVAGGSLLVAGVYWLAYRGSDDGGPSGPHGEST